MLFIYLKVIELDTKAFFRLGLIILLINFCFPTLGKAQVINLSLKQAIDLALNNNTDVAVAGFQTRSTEYSLSEAKGNNLPKVTLNGSYNRNIDKPVIFLPEGLGRGGPTQIGSNNNFVTYLDLSVPIYSRYNTANKNYAYTNFDLQRESTRGIRQTVVVNVKKGYFSHLVALAVVKVREKSLENAEENFSITQSKLAQGIATEFDEATARVKIATARNNHIDAQSRIIPTENNLKLLLGLPLEVKLNLTDSLALTNEELEVLANVDDLLQNSNLKQKELTMARARRQTTMAKASYYPTVSAVGTYQYQSQQNDFNFSNYDWVKTSSLGLRLQLALFNGTVTRNKVQQAIMAEKIAERQKEYIARSNKSQFQQLISQLNYAKQQIALQVENIDVAKKALALVKERYTYGKGTFIEVSNAELEYTTARLNYLQAIMDYKSAYYDFELLTGKEIEK